MSGNYVGPGKSREKQKLTDQLEIMGISDNSVYIYTLRKLRCALFFLVMLKLKYN